MSETYKANNAQKIQEDFSLFEPIPGTVMVRWLSEPETTAGGLFRPDTSLRWEVVGDVLALGKKTNPDWIDLEEGDRVFANSLWGSAVWEGALIMEEKNEQRSCMIRIIGWNEVIAKVRKAKQA